MCSNKSTDQTKNSTKPKPKYTARPIKTNTARGKNNTTTHKTTHSSDTTRANSKHQTRFVQMYAIIYRTRTRNKLSKTRALEMSLVSSVQLSSVQLGWVEQGQKVEGAGRDLCTWPGPFVRLVGLQRLKLLLLLLQLSSKNNFALYEIYVACLHIWCSQHQHLGNGEGFAAEDRNAVAYKLHSNIELVCRVSKGGGSSATPYFLSLNGFLFQMKRQTFTENCHRF